MLLPSLSTGARAALLLIALGLFGCTSVDVGMLRPEPTINITPSSERLTLVLESAVPDSFDLDCAIRGCTVHVTDFRATLRNGYAASLQRFYARGSPGATDLVLRVQMVRAEVVEDARIHMILHYSAQLEDAAGNVRRRAFGSLHAPRTVNSEVELRHGVAMMFERLAADCFGRNGAATGGERRRR